jgi:guanylate kinase
MRKGLLYVVSGPSGAGKTTVIERVLQQDPQLIFSVSYTTRQPRKNETDGVQYTFIDEHRFQRLIEEDDFLEYANVHGYYYGTSKSFVFPLLQSGKDVLLDIDVQGALNVRKTMPESLLVFLAPPGLRELAVRLKNRATEKREDLYKRLSDSKWEMSHIREFQYLVINQTVEKAVYELKTIIESQRFSVVSRIDAIRTFEEEIKDYTIEREE